VKKKENSYQRRRFLVSYVPPKIERRSKLIVYEGHLATGDDRVAHLLRHGRDYRLNIHIDGSADRSVHSTRLSRRQFSALWPATEGNRAAKLRTTVTRDRWRISLDRYGTSLRDCVSPMWSGSEQTQMRRISGHSSRRYGSDRR